MIEKLDGQFCLSFVDLNLNINVVSENYVEHDDSRADTKIAFESHKA